MPFYECPKCNHENHRVECNTCGTLWNMKKIDECISFDEKGNEIRNCPGCGKLISSVYTIWSEDDQKHKDYQKLATGDPYRDNMELKVSREVICEKCDHKFAGTYEAIKK